jgi:hypothetical protein
MKITLISIATLRALTLALPVATPKNALDALNEPYDPLWKQQNAAHVVAQAFKNVPRPKQASPPPATKQASPPQPKLEIKPAKKPPVPSKMNLATGRITPWED